MVAKVHNGEHQLPLGRRTINVPETCATLLELAYDGPPGARTSGTDPIEVGWVPVEGVAGQLGLAMAPGRQERSGRAPWHRDLHGDLRRLRHRFKVHTLVTLLPDDELQELNLQDLANALQVHEIDQLRLPIRDGGVPSPYQIDELLDLILDLLKRLRDGRNVVLHCRAGQGRSGMLAALVGVALGLRPQEAIDQVRAVQPRAVETVAQELFVSDMALTWARRRMGERT